MNTLPRGTVILFSAVLADSVTEVLRLLRGLTTYDYDTVNTYVVKVYIGYIRG